MNPEDEDILDEADTILNEIEITDLDLDFDGREKKRTFYYSSIIDPSTTACMDNYGIYIEKKKYNTKLQDWIPGKRILIYKWNKFQVEAKYYHELGTNSIWKYNYKIKEESFQNHTFKQMKSVMSTHCFQGVRGGRAIITDLLSQHLKNNSIPDITSSIRPVIGFTNEGWTLPGKYNFIRDEAFLGEISKNIQNVMKFKVDPEKAIKMMRSIYDLTSIKYKDIIFSYGLVAPFLYALRDRIRIMPILALGGLKETGKSTMCELITSKFWGNTLAIIGPGVMARPSRAEPVFATSTFPVTLDESEDLPSNLTGIIKTYTTSEDHYVRKNPDQSYRIYVPYSAPLVLNFNKQSIQFENSAFRDRVVFLDIRKTIAHPDWDETYYSIPFGYIGKYVMDVTENWDGNAVYNWYKEANDFGVDQKRVKKIVKIFSLGAELMKQIFDIKLDISELPKVIQETKEMGSDELIELLKFQVEIGIDKVSQFIKSGDPENQESTEIFEFKRKSWVRNEIFEGKYAREDGYFLDINNKIDIERQFCSNKRESRLSMRELTDLIADKWPGVHYGSHYIIGNKKKSIFIPKKYLED